VSFTAATRRARDATRPINERVRGLYDTLHWFAPFGYHGTIERLRFAVGARDYEWTHEQLLAATDLIEAAYRSWHIYEIESIQRYRCDKRRDPRRRSAGNQLDWDSWWDEYLASLPSDIWHIGELGDCDDCAHPWIRHTSSGCRQCLRHTVGPHQVVDALKSACRRPRGCPARR
jgi:hypothetical protein